MKQVVDEVGLRPPDSMTAMDLALEAKLKTLSGDSFDKAYIQAMIKDHRKDLMDFRKVASSGSSRTGKDAAAQGSRVIAEHLRISREMAKSQGVSLSSSGSGRQ